jgi:hypothetical protein
MNRRSFLAATGLGAAVLTAGCSSDRSTAECHLMHEVADSPDDYGDPADSYNYDELSDDARTVFDETVTDGSYATTNRSLDSPEFRYRDTTTVYNVTKGDETYVLLTYTGEGCENE